jgi:hypothetical protein
MTHFKFFRERFRVATFLRLFTAMALVSFLAASCAIIPRPVRSVHLGEDSPAGRCAELFQDIDGRIARAQVVDPGAFRIDDFPYLRTDRFLASFRDEVADEAAFSAWIHRLMTLDRNARRFEMANLEGVEPFGDPYLDAAMERVVACGDTLMRTDFDAPSARSSMAATVRAPDDYILPHRWLGLYPLTRLFVSLGVSDWHRQARDDFSNHPPEGWRSNRYSPPPVALPGPADRRFSRVKRDALKIPDFSEDHRRYLFRTYAPVWEVRKGGPADRIGRPYWNSKGEIDIDATDPATYTLISFTRFKGLILTQLNYIAWFPERPKAHPFDLFGGLLDGIVYRVTLGENGAPLLYETVHSCGCYYKAYPTGRLTVVQNPPYAEPPLVLTAPEIDHSRSSMAIAMESGTHYVNHLYPVPRLKAEADTTEVYSLSSSGDLRSLESAKGGRRSMFQQNGITRGTERLERLILWPTGVYSPGAMRQWGRHAVAFAGKRHFDDPFYMDKMFR